MTYLEMMEYLRMVSFDNAFPEIGLEILDLMLMDEETGLYYLELQ